MEPPPKPVQLPKLEILPRGKGWKFQAPTKKINDGADVSHFLTSKAYRDICVFVLQLNRSLCPRKKSGAPANAGTVFTLASPRDDPPSVRRLQTLLDKVVAIVDETPPDPGPRRFGNIAFRTWHKHLEDRVDALLAGSIAPEILSFDNDGEQPKADDSAEGKADEHKIISTASAIDELRAYFLGSFGSSQRLDYGTGHELSFLAFLGGLWKLGAFTDGPESDHGDIERSIVLGVFEQYLKVIRKLILTYTLEPAGSHGVWGLDDHSFLPYIFGSAQLTRPISEDETMPLEGSVMRAPKLGDITKVETVEVQRELNMYFSAVGFINDVKKGPFWEHSPMLWDVSGIKDGWGKVNKGMIKMFNAEVLSKFPVVQHFPIGSLFSWEVDPEAPIPTQSVHMQNQPVFAATGQAPMGMPPTGMPPPQLNPMGVSMGTAAPWAQGGRMPAPGISSRVQQPVTGTTRPPPPDPVARQSGGPAAASSGTNDGQAGLTKAPWA
ncbi:serine/threonine-protein phosphatase 2A activator 1 [Pyricularia oryzae 70-15]|uniref:Serine/threonine-protein phosphatase 2A activator n=3 Tax=Pyricularia oryzae TaxID=318829 RepID=G4NGG6_PYRO7|nr:serine/threonine-protein phosphatase 2A activator 1 [Pyricularia oryzae 70-15]EHA47123.1 serine/threonine-protein phosphatase 2A activator 1 [Pyricularia oryzae 70-15]ELQ41231.1 serine/threonine-protein phosphatase 2A activator 1 [Pyricularia oryzae Y34]KAI7922582.1 serine/threonine-protein phosphatase 2A activator 1 [Pyricularia oryzae]KAI7922763.1 serine/threonine-protein phosphatase 2A activator 1 [Pyricularia oryzae]